MGYSSPQIISNIDRGLCDPPIKSLKKLAKLLRLKSDDKKDLYRILIKKNEITLKNALKKFYTGYNFCYFELMK